MGEGLTVAGDCQSGSDAPAEVAQRYWIWRGEAEQVMEKARDVFFVIDATGCILYVNQAGERLWRKPRNCLIGQALVQVVDWAGETSLFWQSCNNAAAQQRCIAYETFLTDWLAWFEVAVYPMQAGMLVQLRDISERKWLQETLLQQAAQYRTILENSPDMITRIDRQLRYIYVNPAVEKVFELLSHKIIGRSLREIGRIQPEICDLWEEKCRLVMETGRAQLFEFSVAKQRKTFYYQAHMVPEHGRDGKIQSMLAITRDITGSKLLDQEMGRIERFHLIGEMAASIGHEVRNPLTTVRGFLQMMAGKSKLLEFKPYFRLMIEELDRASEIISEFLSLARNRRVTSQPTDLNQVLETLQPLLQADALRLGCDIKMVLRPLPLVEVEEREIRQCVLNLVRNGLEAMGKGGVLEVRTEMRGLAVALSVQDDGPGIAADILPYLGTPFLTSKEKGTGLGLAVCYSIVERNKGRIEVETGKTGTTFTLLFSETMPSELPLAF